MAGGKTFCRLATVRVGKEAGAKQAPTVLRKNGVGKVKWPSKAGAVASTTIFEGKKEKRGT